MTGTSNCFRLRTGFQVRPRGPLPGAIINQTYLVTHVVAPRLRVRCAGSRERSGDRESGYQNEFTCVPASAPYRPPRITPIPKLPGVLTAKVESAGGDYAPIDDQGRYRVRFPFDLGKEGKAQATKPVRLAQPYSGPDYGQHFPVHKDAEMVVACVDGNVDRIIGLSTVPNPSQASPVTSANQTENTIRTAKDNHIVLQDLKGKEGIDISTPGAASRIHLGEAENAVQGIQSTTEGTQSIHANNGVFIKTGKVMGDPDFIMAAKDLNDLGSYMTGVDSAIGIALAALGTGKGALHNASFWRSALNNGIGTAMGLGLPGVFVASEGGIIMGTTAGISAYAGAGGIGFTTLSGIDLTTATLGINLMAGTGGINIGVGSGDIETANGKGDIKVNSKTGKILTEAQDNILFTSHKKNFHVQTPDSDGSVRLFAGKDIEFEAKKNIVSAAGEDFAVKADKDVTLFAKKHGRIKADEQISLVCGRSEIVLTRGGDITIKAGDSKIKLGASGIEMTTGAPGGPPMSKMKLASSGSALLEAQMKTEVKAGLKAALEGTMVDVMADGILAVKGTLTKVG